MRGCICSVSPARMDLVAAAADHGSCLLLAMSSPWPCCALPCPSLPPLAVVFNTDGREIPIVHRIIKVHQRAHNSSSLDILTKVRRQGGAATLAVVS